MQNVKTRSLLAVLICILGLALLIYMGIHFTADNKDKKPTNKHDNSFREPQGLANAVIIPANGYIPDNAELDIVQEIINNRLDSFDVSNAKAVANYKAGQIDVSFYCINGEVYEDVIKLFDELCVSSPMIMRKGEEPDDEIVLTGADVKSVEIVEYDDYAYEQMSYCLELILNDEGTQKFAQVTQELYQIGGVISLWVGDELICAPTVQSPIVDGVTKVTGPYTYDEYVQFAEDARQGLLSFELEVKSIDYN